MISPALKTLASLRLTVALLGAAMVLIFVGTIAQTRLGVWQAVDEYFRSPIAWVDLSLFTPNSSPDARSPFRLPVPGGLLISALMIVNLLAAHVVRFKATRRRVGIIALHAGIIVLLAGEMVTGFFSQEGLMSIDEGTRTSFIEDVREAELAILDPSDPGSDRLITIPHTLIARAARDGSTITDPRLPFDISVHQWMPNATLFRATGPTPATRGIGLEAFADEDPRARGVDGAETDRPAAYITLTRDNQPIGTWLVSAALVDPQRVETDDTAYAISLRYRRTYLPFALHLDDFRHDTFTGTSIARNFSSDVRIIDPDRNTDRAVRIWMNNPLRYAGRTFYQSSYKPDGTGTVLQVVRNPGWLLPYIACILVAGGMTFHFAQTLARYLHRRRKATPTRPGATHGPRRFRWWTIPLGACAIVVAISGAFRDPPAGDYDTEAFGEIPVSAGGRIKPMDTAARSMLMLAGGRQQVRTENATIPATRFLLDLIARPQAIADLPVVRVDHPDVLSLLDLTPEDSGRIPLSAIQPHWSTVTEQAGRAASQTPRERDGFQRAILELHHRVNTVLAHSQMREPYAIPPLGPDGSWAPFHQAFLDDQAADTQHPSVAYFVSMMTAASENDPDRFNSAVHAYLDLLDQSMPAVTRDARLEVLFNRASLFTGSMVLYILAALGVCISFLLRSRPTAQAMAERFRAGSFAIILAAAIVHTAAILIRIHLQGRPPVTNLYSSAIFVGWAAVLAGALIERLHPIGVAILGSATIGVGTLIVAHNLGAGGDTMEMMQAVLDSNFWLATHVITITLGYSATFLAGAIATVYLLGRALTRAITREREQAMSRMIYGVVCFALLLSFVGTVLGGIWADQSWGRFWGWDPKENGAALIVLINAIILHARWGAMVRAKGIAVLAVAGNIVTVWSWFGTNMLGVGLHSYGFMDSAAFWLGAFVVSQLLVMLIGGTLPARPQRSASMKASSKTADHPAL